MKHTIRYNTPSIIYQYDSFQIWSVQILEDIIFEPIKSLQKLKLGHNKLIEIPNWCDVEFNSYFPNLEYLALDNNCISELNQILCLPEEVLNSNSCIVLTWLPACSKIRSFSNNNSEKAFAGINLIQLCSKESIFSCVIVT
jgi:hypothetical protein